MTAEVRSVWAVDSREHRSFKDVALKHGAFQEFLTQNNPTTRGDAAPFSVDIRLFLRSGRVVNLERKVYTDLAGSIGKLDRQLSYTDGIVLEIPMPPGPPQAPNYERHYLAALKKLCKHSLRDSESFAVIISTGPEFTAELMQYAVDREGL